jgi:hypothetical protein
MACSLSQSATLACEPLPSSRFFKGEAALYSQTSDEPDPESRATYTFTQTVAGVGTGGLVGVGKATSMPAQLPASAARIRRTFAGITCTWAAYSVAVACERGSRPDGYLIGLSPDFVQVRSPKHEIVFFRNHPAKSRGLSGVIDSRIVHRETHRGVACYWTRQDGGGAGCSPADHHGFIAFVGHSSVRVTNEAGRTVFVRNQP